MFAVLFGIRGFLTFNMLLVLVAIFVFIGADAGIDQVVIQALLGHLLVRDVMGAPPAVIRAETSLDDAAERMLREKQLCLAVMTAPARSASSRSKPCGRSRRIAVGSSPRAPR